VNRTDCSVHTALCTPSLLTYYRASNQGNATLTDGAHAYAVRAQSMRSRSPSSATIFGSD